MSRIRIRKILQLLIWKYADLEFFIMKIAFGNTDLKPIIFGVFTVLILNVLSVFPVLLSSKFMLVPSLVFLAPLSPISIYYGMLVTVILAQKNKKRQVIYMILVLQSFLFLLNLIRLDAPRPLLKEHNPGLYMLLTLVTNTPVYIIFGLFAAWFYEKFFGKSLKKPQTGGKEASDHH